MTPSDQKETSLKADLWICERKAHLPEHDGATGYFYYTPVVQVPQEVLNAVEYVKELKTYGEYPGYVDYKFLDVLVSAALKGNGGEE